jgi:Disulphide bond corrector protein DsbC
MFKRCVIASCTIFPFVIVLGCSERSESRIVGQNQAFDVIPSDSSQLTAVDLLPPQTQTTEQATTQIQVPVPTSNAPVAFTASLDRTSAKPGEILKFIVHGRILSNWHIYSADGPSGISYPTRFKLRLQNGILKVGDWKYPEARMDLSIFGPTSKYVDEFQASVDLKLADSLSAGPIDVECSVQYQACNLNQCLQPTTIWLSVPIHVSKGEGK